MPNTPSPSSYGGRTAAMDRLFNAAKSKLTERQAERGSISQGTANLGKMWAGILSDYYGLDLPPLPAGVVSLMMAQLKAGRYVRPQATIHSEASEDDAVDLVAYAMSGLYDLRTERQSSSSAGPRSPQAEYDPAVKDTSSSGSSTI